MTWTDLADAVVSLDELDDHLVLTSRQRGQPSLPPIYLKPDPPPMERCPGRHRLLDLPTGRGQHTRHHYFLLCSLEDASTFVARMRRAGAKLGRVPQRHVDVSALYQLHAEVSDSAEKEAEA